MTAIFKNIALRLLPAVLLFIAANYLYTRYGYERDVRRFSRVKHSIDSAFATGDIIYLGESSNTSFNPWTDTFAYSISEFLQMYLPDRRVRAITHEGYHAGLFRKMLQLMPDHKPPAAVVLTMNLRTCGPSAVFSSNEASNWQEALFYSQRPALLTRLFLSLKFYDNAPPPERERAKLQYWRTVRIDAPGTGIPYKTVRDWYDHNPYHAADVPEKLQHMADAYIKEFAFRLNDKNPRVQDLDRIASDLARRKVPLILVLLPENRDYAAGLFGQKLLGFMDSNAAFLARRYQALGSVRVINMYLESTGADFTDQWYPTEHFNARVRQRIARAVAAELGKPATIAPTANNRPNPDIRQPMADTLVHQFGPR